MSNSPRRSETASLCLSLLPERFLQDHEMFEPYSTRVARQDLQLSFARTLSHVIANDLRAPTLRKSEPQIVAGPLIVILRKQTGYTLVPETNGLYSPAMRDLKAMDLHFIGTRKDLPALPHHIRNLAKRIEKRNIAEEWPLIAGLTHQDVALMAIRLGMRGHNNVQMNNDKRIGVERAHRTTRRLYGKPVGKTKISAVWIPTTEFIELGKSLRADGFSPRRGRLRRA